MVRLRKLDDSMQDRCPLQPVRMDTVGKVVGLSVHEGSGMQFVRVVAGCLGCLL